MAYIYRHIRIDTNEPFYIGLGIHKNRATTKRGRSKKWNEVVATTDYIIEVILDDLTLEQASFKEKEFILMYGRLDKGTGSLVNHTDGGEKGGFEKGYSPWTTGRPGYGKGTKLSLEHRLKLSKGHKGTPITMTKARLEADIKKRKGGLCQFDLNWNLIKIHATLSSAVKDTGLDSGGISKAANGILKQTGGFRWKYQEQPEMQPQ